MQIPTLYETGMTPKVEFLLRLRYDPELLGLTHPIWYYLNQFNAHFQKGNYILQFEDFQGGLLVYGKHLNDWLKNAQRSTRMFRFQDERPDWVTEEKHTIGLECEILNHELEHSQLEFLCALPNIFFRLFGIQAFLEIDRGMRGSFIFQNSAALNELLEMILTQFGTGRFFYEEF